MEFTLFLFLQQLLIINFPCTFIPLFICYPLCWISLYIIDILVKYEEYNSCCKYTNLFVKLQLTEYLNLASQPRDEHVQLFSFRSLIVCERPISFVFFKRSEKLIPFVLKIIVHFPSISFVFSLNDRFLKFFFSNDFKSFFYSFVFKHEKNFTSLNDPFRSSIIRFILNDTFFTKIWLVEKTVPISTAQLHLDTRV